MMKIRLAVLVMAVLFVGSAAVSAQTTAGANRTRACTLLPGYTIADVVETARNFEWAEDMAPGLVVISNKVAVSGTFDFDFLVNFYWPSYADMVEKQGRWLQSQAGTNGRRGFDGMATCTDNSRMSSIRRATDAMAPSSFEPLTAMITVSCELNGASNEDVMAAAKRIGDNFGATALVTRRNFGGPRVFPFNSEAGMRFVFPSWDDFGEGMDTLMQNPAPTGQNAMSCGTASLWASHRIHSRNN